MLLEDDGSSSEKSLQIDNDDASNRKDDEIKNIFGPFLTLIKIL